MNSGDRLSADIISLIGHVGARLGAARTALMHQARLAIVTSYSPTALRVEVPPGAPLVEAADGPIPGRALVYGVGGVTSEIMVWIRGGKLIMLEQPWYTDNPPVEWPTAEMVHLL